jgi:hypothetical protein
MKVFIINGNYQYQSMFVKAGWDITDDFFKADLIQFTGGEDVTPEIYGEINTNSHNNFNRDLIEAGYFALAIRCNKPMAGICRGGQFLNVMCGGKMIQHVEGHAIHGTHEIVTNDAELIQVTSTHHQMMVPEKYSAELVAWGNIVHKADDKFHPDYEEYDSEVLYFNENCLCFQPHPEFPGYEDCTAFYFKLLDEYLGLRS